MAGRQMRKFPALIVRAFSLLAWAATLITTLLHFMNRRSLFALTTAFLFASLVARAADPLTLELPGGEGPGKGKHIVLLAGDEEYRSEEALPMLAGLLSQHHGFRCTVLFSVGADGTIDPNNQKSLTGAGALDSADAIVMLLRFRNWPDDVMKHFVDAYHRGIPIVALRTATHAFQFDKNSSWGKYTWNNAQGGFGRTVLGETWVSHWGSHKSEGTAGVIEQAAKDHPVLRGVKEIFADTDVYEAYPPADATILVRGQVVKGMKPGAPPADYKKKRSTDQKEQGINDPMMAVAWLREYKNDSGTTNRILTTTMGAATDFQSEGLRRMVVNGVYWGLKMDVPAAANVTLTGDYKPTMYAGNGGKKGVKPADTVLKPATK